MIVRVLVGVAVAAALLAASTPGIRAARVARGTHVGSTASDRLVDAVDALVAGSDPTPPGTPGAGARVTVRLPPAGLTVPRVTVFLGHRRGTDGDPGSARAASVVGYRVAGARAHRTPLPRPVVPADGGSRIVVRSGERVTLTFQYVTGRHGARVRAALGGRDPK